MFKIYNPGILIFANVLRIALYFEPTSEHKAFTYTLRLKLLCNCHLFNSSAFSITSKVP